jgi:hypothetical protein
MQGMRAGQSSVQEMQAGESGGTQASFVLHDSGASTVTLGPQGGTITVDLVLSSQQSLLGFGGRLGASAAEVVSFDASETAPAITLAGDWAPVATASQSSDEPALILLSVLTSQPVDIQTLSHPAARPYGDVFVTDVSVWAMAAEPRSAVSGVVATMRLHVAGVPGTYQVTFTAGYLITADDVFQWLSAGEPLQVTVPGE